MRVMKSHLVSQGATVMRMSKKRKIERGRSARRKRLRNRKEFKVYWTCLMMRSRKERNNSTEPSSQKIGAKYSQAPSLELYLPPISCNYTSTIASMGTN